MVSFPADPAVALAVKVTGLPLSPAEVAVRVLFPLPAVVPRTQLPTVAMPAALVVCDSPETLPPPAVTANVTLTPPTPFPAPSVTFTEGAGETGLPAVPVSDVDELFVILAAEPVLTLNWLLVAPERPVALACSV